jgi:membrane associated rhomboid family serine protease
VSAGASGAIFGLYGALLGFLVRHRGSIPAESLASLRKGR